ncbi:uncharacterized protein V3H82_022361 [Fundulus diaphanus]
MRSAAVFLLMLCCSIRNSRSEFSVPADDRTRTEAHALRDLGVLWDEVQGLKDLVLSLKGEEVERRQELRSVESRLRDGEMVAEQQKQSLVEVQVAVGRQIDSLRRTLLTEQASVLRSKMAELEVQSKAQAAAILELQARINTSESSVESLKKKNAVLAAELPFLQTRLRASESTVEQLRRKDAEIQACNSSAVMVSEVVVLEGRLKIHLDKLKANIEGQVHELENKLDSSQLRLEELSAAAENRLNEAERQQDELRKHNTELVSRLRSSEKQLGDLKMLNRDMEIRLRSTEGHLNQFKNHTTELVSRLRSSEEQLEDLKTTNTNMEVRLGSTEGQLGQLKNHTTDLVSRVRSGEEQLEDLKTTNTDMEVRLGSTDGWLDHLKNHTADMEVRLGSTEGQLAQLKNHTTVLEVRLRVSERQLEEQKAENSEFETKLSAVALQLNVKKEQLDDLKRQSLVRAAELASLSERLAAAQGNTEDELKVAFSAGLTDSGIVGPFDKETTLTFTKIIANIGQGYNSSAGDNTLKLFCFTAADYLKGYMGLYLYRNDQPIIFSLDLNDHGGYASITSALALQLDEGDRVRVALPASYRLYDDSRNFSVFSGFLLFPV